MTTAKKAYWTPTKDQIESSNMYKMMTDLNDKYSLTMDSYDELHSWSVDNKKEFWSYIWELAEVKHSLPFTDVYLEDNNRLKIPRPIWFPSAKLNFAENLLKYNDDSLSIIAHREGQENVRI